MSNTKRRRTNSIEEYLPYLDDYLQAIEFISYGYNKNYIDTFLLEEQERIYQESNNEPNNDEYIKSLSLECEKNYKATKTCGPILDSKGVSRACALYGKVDEQKCGLESIMKLYKLSDETPEIEMKTKLIVKGRHNVNKNKNVWLIDYKLISINPDEDKLLYPNEKEPRKNSLLFQYFVLRLEDGNIVILLQNCQPLSKRIVEYECLDAEGNKIFETDANGQPIMENGSPKPKMVVSGYDALVQDLITNVYKLPEDKKYIFIGHSFGSACGMYTCAKLFSQNPLFFNNRCFAIFTGYFSVFDSADIEGFDPESFKNRDNMLVFNGCFQGTDVKSFVQEIENNLAKKVSEDFLKEVNADADAAAAKISNVNKTANYNNYPEPKIPENEYNRIKEQISVQGSFGVISIMAKDSARNKKLSAYRVAEDGSINNDPNNPTIPEYAVIEANKYIFYDSSILLLNRGDFTYSPLTYIKGDTIKGIYRKAFPELVDYEPTVPYFLDDEFTVMPGVIFTDHDCQILPEDKDEFKNLVSVITAGGFQESLFGTKKEVTIDIKLKTDKKPRQHTFNFMACNRYRIIDVHRLASYILSITEIDDQIYDKNTKYKRKSKRRKPSFPLNISLNKFTSKKYSSKKFSSKKFSLKKSKSAPNTSRRSNTK